MVVPRRTTAEELVARADTVAEAGFPMVRVGYISQPTFPSQIVYGENYR